MLVYKRTIIYKNKNKMWSILHAIYSDGLWGSHLKSVASASTKIAKKTEFYNKFTLKY